jgi:hypothetical protein
LSDLAALQPEPGRFQKSQKLRFTLGLSTKIHESRLYLGSLALGYQVLVDILEHWCLHTRIEEQLLLGKLLLRHLLRDATCALVVIEKCLKVCDDE